MADEAGLAMDTLLYWLDLRYSTIENERRLGAGFESDKLTFRRLLTEVIKESKDK